MLQVNLIHKSRWIIFATILTPRLYFLAHWWELRKFWMNSDWIIKCITPSNKYKVFYNTTQSIRTMGPYAWQTYKYFSIFHTVGNIFFWFVSHWCDCEMCSSASFFSGSMARYRRKWKVLLWKWKCMPDYILIFLSESTVFSWLSWFFLLCVFGGKERSLTILAHSKNKNENSVFYWSLS